MAEMMAVLRADLMERTMAGSRAHHLAALMAEMMGGLTDNLMELKMAG